VEHVDPSQMVTLCDGSAPVTPPSATGQRQFRRHLRRV